MGIYSYVVRYDIGFAPNPFHDWCTLATCKQDFRGRVAIGDWVVGTGSKAKCLDGHLVYAMQVEEKLTFTEYWGDPRFQCKRPNLNGSIKQRYGDNIYSVDGNGDWLQANSRHSLDNGSPNAGHVVRDTKTNAVLASTHFVYWGGAGPAIPAPFRDWNGIDICTSRPGYRCRFPEEMQDEFVTWIRSSTAFGLQSDPADWQ